GGRSGASRQTRWWLGAPRKSSRRKPAAPARRSFRQTPAFPGEHRNDRSRPSSSPLWRVATPARRATCSNTNVPTAPRRLRESQGVRNRTIDLADRTVTGINRNKAPMRIVDIRECAIPLKSDMRNSSFDFSEMTTSVVAVITDVVRNGKPVIGFAFNSTGRYACGAAMRARFIPRILGADPRSLLDEAQENFDPRKILA